MGIHMLEEVSLTPFFEFQLHQSYCVVDLN